MMLDLLLALVCLCVAGGIAGAAAVVHYVVTRWSGQP